MKVAWIGLSTVFVAAPAWAAVIAATAASSHVGQSVTVEGTVSEVHAARSGKETFIDLGGIYPNQTFTAVIFARSMATVVDISGLKGKTVDITGTIQLYEGKPDMIIIARDQIKAK